MKWWIDYKVTVKFVNFPYPCEANGKISEEEGGFMGLSNLTQFYPYPVHSCTENIHLRINNKDLTTYPIQMVHQKLGYMEQEALRESCEFCPHRKPNTQTLYEDRSHGRSPFMNIGTTYDGDYGNEVILGNIVLSGFDSEANKAETDTYTKSFLGEEEEKYKPWKFCNGMMTFTVREPVMAEPLGYQSSKGGNNMMNNISNIDLEFNFNNLRNMIQFNCAQLYAKSSKNYLYDKIKMRLILWMELNLMTRTGGYT